jgi:hypothetical protein
MTDQEIIKVVMAHQEGKQIECRAKDSDGDWNPAVPLWDFDNFNYRVKREPRVPREWWIIKNDCGLDDAWRTEQKIGVHVREVL